MKKIILFSAIFLTSGMVFALPAFSQSPTPVICPQIYGGGLVCQEATDFRVDKKVQNPKDGSFVDQLPENETKIAPDHTMIFRIILTNKTSRTLRNIAVTDTLPYFVNFVRSDSSVKQNKQQISYTIDTLEANKATTVNIEAKASPKESLPDTSSLCVANQVEAKSGFTNDAKDFVTFCIDKNGPSVASTVGKPQQPSFPSQTKGGQLVTTPIPTQPTMTKGGQAIYPAPRTTTNPNTGPEVFALIGLLPAGLAGLILRKKSTAKKLRN